MSLDRLEDQLREVLHEHSVLPPTNPDRDTDLERRIGRRRRARMAGLAAVAAVLAVGASAGALALPSRGPASQVTAAATRPAASASPAPSQAPPLPEYSAGYQRISQQRITLPGTGKLVLTYTPETLDFKIGFSCAAVPGQILVLSVNGIEAGSKMCGGGTLPGADPPTELPGGAPGPGNVPGASGPTSSVFWLGGSDRKTGYHTWTALKVAVGRPSTFLVMVGSPVAGAKGQDPSAGPPTAAGDVYAGVYLPAPFEKYPLPPSPSSLKDLDALETSATPGFPDGLGLLDSRTLGSPNGSHSMTLTMPKFLDMTFCAVAPGQVTFLVDGQQADRSTFWDWTGACYSGSAVAGDVPQKELPSLKGVRTGQKVIVTVVTAGFAPGSWRVGFDRSP